MKLPLLMVMAAAACGGSNEKTTTTNTTTTTQSEPVMVEEEPVAQTLAEETGPQPAATEPLPEAQPIESPPVERLDKLAIRSVIRRSIPYIQKCYEDEVLKQPGLQGTTTVTFMITPSGQVESSVGSGFDATVDLCVANFIATLSFPPAMNPTQVNYPFKFQAAGGAAVGSPTP
jgi:outer membrane biosynthesis protein TonB